MLYGCPLLDYFQEGGTGMNIVAAEQLSKWYGEVIGLNQFTVNIGEGITGIVGPNGAGKTTLMRIMTGMIRQGKGHIEVLGEQPWNNTVLNAKIGYCPEHEVLYPWMSGKEFLVTMARMQGCTKNESERRAYASLKIVGLGKEVIDRKIRSYSKGMRQKVKVAQAIIYEPELLILDEPLAGTDPVGRKILIDLIKELAKQGIHSIVSSHVLYEIERLTNQVVLISAGQILATGDFHEIRKLIDKHPHAVNITTPDARKLGIALMELENVVAATVMDDQRLMVKTRAPDSFYDQLPGIIVDGGYEVREMFSPDNNLQAVFRYLVKR